jgi:hypothetical protein
MGPWVVWVPLLPDVVVGCQISSSSGKFGYSLRNAAYVFPNRSLRSRDSPSMVLSLGRGGVVVLEFVRDCCCALSGGWYVFIEVFCDLKVL